MDKQVIADGPFSSIIPDGVRVGQTIHLSGAVSVDAEGEPMHEGDFLAQNRQAYANIAACLAAFGADMSNVVKETVFVTDMSMPMGNPEAPFEDYAAMRDEVYSGNGNHVAQSLIQCAGLVFPQLLVEIEVTAHV